MQVPASNLYPNRFHRLVGNCRAEIDEELPLAILRSSWPKRIAQKIEFLVRIRPPPVIILAIDNLRLLRMKLQPKLGPGTSPPADGVAFSFGPDVYAGAAYSETGATGTGDLAIWFHTWNNGPSTVGGVIYPVNAPAVNISFGGTQIGLYLLTAAQMVDSQFHDVSIQLTRAGK